MNKITLTQRSIAKLLKNNFKTCLMEDSNCTKEIIGAHSIQNKNILEYITDPNNKLFYLTHEDKDFNQIGVNQASIFYGLCKKHDNDLFTLIDHNKLNEISYNNLDKAFFLYAFKALFREIYVKKNVILTHEKIFEHYENDNLSFFNKNFPFLNTVERRALFSSSSSLQEAVVGNVRGIEDLQGYLSTFKTDFSNENFCNLFTYNLECSTNLVALNSCFSAEYLPNGQQLQNPRDLNINLKPLFLNVVPNQHSSTILISCIKQDLDTYGVFFDHLKSMDTVKRLRFLQCLIVCHCENFFFSQKLIGHTGLDQIKKLKKLFVKSAGQVDLKSYYVNDLSKKIKFLHN